MTVKNSVSFQTPITILTYNHIKEKWYFHIKILSNSLSDSMVSPAGRIPPYIPAGRCGGWRCAGNASVCMETIALRVFHNLAKTVV
jgi:hypothetical protein